MQKNILNMNKNIKNKLLILLGVVVIATAMDAGFYLGYQKGTETPKTITIQGVSNFEKGQPKNIDFSIFWEAWEKLKDKYVNQNFDDQELVYGAISGLVNSLEDPNTNFFPPSEAKKFQENVQGSFGGVGIEIDVRDNQLQVVSPLKDTPAEKAGLRAGDKILEVDEISTVGFNTDQAVDLIRGKVGTPVTLTIMRDSWSEPKDITITREIIEIPSLDWKMLDNGIAYIQLYNFYQNVDFNFYQAAASIYSQNPKGIILDLRDNPGGYLETSVNIAGWFLKPGELVVSEEFASGQKQQFKASGNGVFKDLPIVILVNGGSASASEILAGALRDNRKIELIGEKTFGKGTVQEIVPLTDNSSMKITVAHWLMPSGKLIEENGLVPDYEIKLTEDDIKNSRDPQFDKALEIIKPKIESTQKTLFDLDFLNI